MRPQHFAADHAADTLNVARPTSASMRPQHFAADHLPTQHQIKGADALQ